MNPNGLLIALLIVLGTLALATQNCVAQGLDPVTVSEDEAGGKTPAEQLAEAVSAIKALSENRPIDGVTAIALLLLGSLVVDRFASGSLALLSIIPAWESSFKDPASFSQEQRREKTIARAKLVGVYYLLAALAAFGLTMLFQNVLVWKSLGFDLTKQEDLTISAFVMIIGAERIAQWFQLPGSPSAGTAQPVELSGNLTLVEPQAKNH